MEDKVTALEKEMIMRHGEFEQASALAQPYLARKEEAYMELQNAVRVWLRAKNQASK